MTDFISQIALLTLGWGSLVVIYAYFAWRKRQLEKQIEDFRVFKLCLDAHYEAVDQFVGDPAAPPSLIRLLVALQGVIGDRDFARLISVGLSRGTSRKDVDSATKSIWNEVRDLSRTRPELAELFERAFETGIIATILREPETSRLFKSAMGNLARDHRTGAAYVVRAQANSDPDDLLDEGCAVPA